MILAGLWSAKVKPSMQLYMQPIYTMLKNLESIGIILILLTPSCIKICTQRFAVLLAALLLCCILPCCYVCALLFSCHVYI